MCARTGVSTGTIVPSATCDTSATLSFSSILCYPLDFSVTRVLSLWSSANRSQSCTFLSFSLLPDDFLCNPATCVSRNTNGPNPVFSHLFSVVR